MNNEEINTDSNIDGDNNSVNNTINSYNKIVINNYSTGDIYQISVLATIVLRDFYESMLNNGGQIEMISFLFNQEYADELKVSWEELYRVKCELFAEDLIKGSGAFNVKLTERGKDVGRWFHKNRPKEYDQERERVLKFFIVQAACNLHSRLDFAGLLSIESKFTEVVVRELERDGLITKYMNNGEMVDRDLKGEFQRKATPVFYERYAKEIATHRATIRS